MKKEARTIENFDKIKFQDFGTLILTQGEQVSLTVEADEEILAELISEVRNDTLVLGVEDDWVNRFGKVVSSLFNNTAHNVVYYLTVVDIEKLAISGKCHLECESLKTNTLKLNLSGLGNLAFGHLDCNELDIKISGRGEFSAAGRADHQVVRISGSADYQAPNLACQSLRINISGQGNATVRVEESLDITISGMGQINYFGQPKIRQVISGIGKSKRLNE